MTTLGAGLLALLFVIVPGRDAPQPSLEVILFFKISIEEVKAK